MKRWMLLVVVAALGCSTAEDPQVAAAADAACEQIEGLSGDGPLGELGQSLALVSNLEDGMDEDAYMRAVNDRCDLADHGEPASVDEITEWLEEQADQ